MMEMERPSDPKEVEAAVRTASLPRLTRDEAILARFNKKQKLLRRFGTLSAIGITCTLMITWESVNNDIYLPLENGGPAGSIIVYLVAWAGACTQAAVFAEMASMVPLAGGPFNWVAIFSPSWCKKYLSYLAGWLSLISYIALVAGTAFVTGALIQGAIAVAHPDYTQPAWQGTLLFYGALLLCLIFNTWLGPVLPQIESIALFLHVIGFIAVTICLLYLGDHRPSSEVWGTFLNEGDWPSQALSVFVGSVGFTNAFCGLDGADHIAEELHDAARTIPIAIGSSMILNGSLGFAFLLTLLYTMPADIQSLITEYPIYPFIGIYRAAVKSDTAAIVLISILIITSFSGAIGIVATSSRMIWAFAREGGLPGSRFLSRVGEQSRLPVWAIVTVIIINVLLGLINIGSTVGFQAFLSLIVAGYYSSFLLAAAVMLNKRLTTPHHEIPWGPFQMGRYGVPITIVAMIYSFIGAFFSMWPAGINPTAATLNYCPIVYGATLIFSTAFWFLHGKKRYTGPIIEIEP